MLSNLVLFYVGVVLILNGLWMLQTISDHEILFINLAVGLLSLRVAHEYAFGPLADTYSVLQAALTLLFSFTYLWSAFNRAMDNDGRGLGWFSLLVSVTASVVSVRLLGQAGDLAEMWSACSWAAWAVLWFLFFMLLVYRKPWERLTAWMSIGQGVLTGWLPGYLWLHA